MRSLSLPARMICLALTALSTPAFAQDAVAVAQPRVVADVSALIPDTTVAPKMPFAAVAVTEDTLGAIAGREDTTQISYAQQTSQVSSNSIGDNSRTGDARIADNAFQNLSGLSILNVNTGNNVAINASMNVNIAINPAP